MSAIRTTRPLDEQLRDVLCAAARESAPQPYIPRVRGLRLQADEVLNGQQRGKIGAAQEQLPVEGRPVEGTAGQRPHAGTLPRVGPAVRTAPARLTPPPGGR
jgi:hypothetical protein